MLRRGIVPPGRNSIFFGQNTAGVDDGAPWAVHGAHAAAETFGIVNDGHVVYDMDRPGSADLFAHTAANAADAADSPGVLALILIGAFDHDAVGTLMDVDQILRAVGDTSAAGDALVFIDLSDAQFVNGDGAEFAGEKALLTADAAIGAAFWNVLVGPAATVAGHHRSLVGELLFDCHVFPLLTFYRACR